MLIVTWSDKALFARDCGGCEEERGRGRLVVVARSLAGGDRWGVRSLFHLTPGEERSGVEREGGRGRARCAWRGPSLPIARALFLLYGKTAAAILPHVERRRLVGVQGVRQGARSQCMCAGDEGGKQAQQW